MRDWVRQECPHFPFMVQISFALERLHNACLLGQVDNIHQPALAVLWGALPSDMGTHITLRVNRTCAPSNVFSPQEQRPLNMFKATPEAHKYLGLISHGLDKTTTYRVPQRCTLHAKDLCGADVSSEGCLFDPFAVLIPLSSSSSAPAEESGDMIYRGIPSYLNSSSQLPCSCYLL